ncbi:MAG: hypothetical protein B7Z44_13820 [Caulobacter sp. 12-67-6]|nr:MAG: hypothetical protein B7Z44_13820 [Caulobacter sp. 12-67-6]OYX72706.1 MAG: hypothetical protein B7Y81_05525 [Caulobacter sp. 32-67-35]
MCGEATAGAWPMARGQTQVIAKVERQSADQLFDAAGALGDLGRREDETASIFVEHGLTDRLTLQAKAGLTRGRDPFVRYEGRGPVELGLRYALLKRPRTVAAIYLGATEAGAGRNAGYAAPGQGEVDIEARLLLGRSAVTRRGEIFSDLQLARLRRSGLADETRMDATLGFRPARNWLVMAQTYAGEADSKPRKARWLKAELSIVRGFGPWSVQAGWRETVAGREIAKDRGMVLGVWRTF